MNQNEEISAIRIELQRVSDQISRLRQRIDIYDQSPAPRDVKAPVTMAKAVKPVATPTALPPVEKISSTGNLLGVIAAVCFIFAGVFLVRLAIQSGWLTPERQFALSILLGLSLIVVGLRTLKFDTDFSAILPGCGTVILAASAIGGHRYFELYGTFGAVVGMAMVAILSLLLYRKFRHDFFIVTAALGTYGLPFLLKSHGSPLETIGGYFILWTATFSVASILLESRTLPLISGYFGIGAFALIAENVAPTNSGLIALVEFFQAVLIIFSVFRYSFSFNVRLDKQQVWSYFPLALFFYGIEYFYLDKIIPEITPWLGLTLAAVILGIHKVSHRKFEGEDLPSGEMLLSWAAIIAFHSGYLQLLPDPVKPWIVIAALFAIPFIPGDQSQSTVSFLRRNLILVIVIFFIFAIEFLRVLSNNFSKTELSSVHLGILLALGIIFLFIKSPLARTQSASKEEVSHVLLASAHLQAVVALYRWWSADSLAVSVVWSLYPGIVLGLAVYQKDSILGRSSLVVLLIAASKALLYDAANAAAAVRIVCLLITGGLLYGSGLLFRRFSSWN